MLCHSVDTTLQRDVELPEDKYEFGMLLDEAKFYRLTTIVESLRVHRHMRQKKSFRNVMTEKQRQLPDPHDRAPECCVCVIKEEDGVHWCIACFGVG